MDTIVSLGFLILGGGFIGFLIYGIMQMLGLAKSNAKDINALGVFKWAIVFAILLSLFIFFVVVPNS